MKSKITNIRIINLIYTDAGDASLAYMLLGNLVLKRVCWRFYYVLAETT